MAQASDIALGSNWGCAIAHGGRVLCWGDNREGQLLVSREPHPPEALRVPGLETAVSVAIYGRSACALQKDGSLWCWGSVTSPETKPKQFGKVRHGREVAWGNPGLCVNTTEGSVYCADKPGAALKQHEASAVQRLVQSDQARIVGLHRDGQTTLIGGVHAKRAINQSDVMDLALGLHHECALGRDGRVRCAGHDAAGQLGNGKLLSSTIPVEVAPFSTNSAASSR